MNDATLEPLSVPRPWNLAAEGYEEILRPWFAAYAADAIALSGVSAPASVVDVACGPGTLGLVAEERGLKVTAVDFSPRMIAGLRNAVLGDGESLPFADGTFDAGFSMFGVIFFESPARGLAELVRVIRPGGIAVVSSWQPLDETPLLVELFDALRSEDPDLFFPEDELSFPGELESAMVRAGFEEVAVRESTHSLSCASLDDALERLARSTLPLPLLDWKRLRSGVRARLAVRFGEGPQTLVYPAWLAAGRRPV